MKIGQRKELCSGEVHLKLKKFLDHISTNVSVVCSVHNCGIEDLWM
jgi:hypothetical protein